MKIPRRSSRSARINARILADIKTSQKLMESLNVQNKLAEEAQKHVAAFTTLDKVFPPYKPTPLLPHHIPTLEDSVSGDQKLYVNGQGKIGG